MNPQEKIEQIKSLDPNSTDVSQQHGLCRFEPGEDALVRRALYTDSAISVFPDSSTRTATSSPRSRSVVR